MTLAIFDSALRNTEDPLFIATQMRKAKPRTQIITRLFSL